MKRLLLKRIFLICLAFLIALNPISVSALTNSKLKMFSQNNILFYEPDANCQVDGGMYSSKPGGNQITWIGDSYSVGAGAKIEAKIPGVDLTGTGSPSNIQSSKRFGYDINGTSADANYNNHNISSSNPSGLTILKNLVENNMLRKYVVFALGTNDQGISIEPLVEEMINIGGSDHTYVLMTPRTYNYTYGTVISGFKSAASKHSNIIIADWEAAVEKDLDKYFSPSVDTIHPNSAGYDLFVDTIYNALPGGAVGVLGGADNLEKAWNYFATAGIPGVSDNGAAIAGILGNLYQESGANPFSHRSGTAYYGIYQTNAPEMLSAIEAAGLSQYWGSSSAPDDAVARAMQIELDYLTKSNSRFTTDGWSFLKNLDKVANTPEGYSDLFLVAVEGAVTSNATSPYTGTSNYIEDDGARSVGTKYFGSAAGGGKYYQEATERRNFAKKFYSQYSGASSQAIVTSQTSASSGGGFVWENGWLSGMPGLIKQDVSDYSDLNETIRSGYGTSNNKPNKILLHSTEGTSNGYGAYPANNKYPAHFIIDLKKKEAYQNLPITNRALATAASDDSTVQIEIVGFSTPSYIPDKNYYLQDFTANEWDYLVVLLSAISQETGIPLSTSVDWNINYSNPNTVRATDRNNFRENVQGVVGHMHSPPGDDHVDPGNIWPFIEEAIARNPTAAQFGGNLSYNGCSNYSSGNAAAVEGGLTKDQAQALIDYYESSEVSASEWNLPYGKCNCVSLSAFFIQRFTSVGHSSRSWGHGKDVVANLKSSEGLETGSAPRPFAIFSVTQGSTVCDDGHKCGHTGVVVAVEGNTVTTIEAAYGNCGFTGVKTHDISYFTSSKYDFVFAYTDTIINKAEIAAVVGN